MKKKIYYHDTDCGGVVYYGNYLKYLEEARTEFFSDLGVSIKELADNGTLFVVAKAGIEYKSPAHYGDILDIKTWISDVGRIKLEFSYEIKDQNGKLILTARTLMACVDGSVGMKQIPEELRSKLLSIKETLCSTARK